MARAPSHAGSWYSSDEETLSVQLDRWLEEVPETAPCIGPVTGAANEIVALPTSKARVIIAP